VHGKERQDIHRAQGGPASLECGSISRKPRPRGQERALYGSETGEATASGIAGSIGSSAYGKDASALEGR